MALFANTKQAEHHCEYKRRRHWGSDRLSMCFIKRDNDENHGLQWGMFNNDNNDRLLKMYRTKQHLRIRHSIRQTVV
ncbi:hypothetical protein DPMN_143255 [Dreissena polymorpha]|uniref:Uncharacterized protein n=1 Tax=Dreissena polymorpha TaxID=45954 RepID=A0A9D4JJX0_DREPO|nr:hypothetical protein DPMN_143255 [Dreissena polymorpha]